MMLTRECLEFHVLGAGFTHGLIRQKMPSFDANTRYRDRDQWEVENYMVGPMYAGNCLGTDVLEPGTAWSTCDLNLAFSQQLN